MNPLLESVVSFFYPASCRCCQQEIGLVQSIYICDECWKKIEIIQKPYCEVCGRPLPMDSALDLSLSQRYKCGWCLKDPPPFFKARSIAYYDLAIREAIHLLKYQKKEVMSKPLAELMRSNLSTLTSLDLDEYDLLIPIPLHKNRQRDRGYNQVELIVNRLKGYLPMPIETGILFRIKETRPQSLLDRVNEKFENVKGAFGVTSKSETLIRSKKVLLVDDILTTGATVSEAAKTLLKSGVSKVDVVTLARAI